MTPTIEANSGYDSGLCGVIGGFFVCSVVRVRPEGGNSPPDGRQIDVIMGVCTPEPAN